MRIMSSLYLFSLEKWLPKIEYRYKISFWLKRLVTQLETRWKWRFNVNSNFFDLLFNFPVFLWFLMSRPELLIFTQRVLFLKQLKYYSLVQVAFAQNFKNFSFPLSEIVQIGSSINFIRITNCGITKTKDIQIRYRSFTSNHYANVKLLAT